MSSFVTWKSQIGKKTVSELSMILFNDRPLLEAKSVKERFDDLFASSRYVKALDAIRKTRVEQVGPLAIT